MRDGPFGRQSAFDQGGGCGCLCDTIGAGAAGVFGADGDNHAQLRGHDIQPLGAVLANLVHHATPARTVQAIGLDDPLDPRQILGQVAAIALGRSSALSFSDRLPCTTWFSSATRCSRRLLISSSSATRAAVACKASNAAR